LTGNSAANTLNGGTGSDTMIGGTGNDTYVVDNTGDVVMENANEGTDLVLSSVTYTLSANVENLTLTGTAAINGTGNTLNNVLTGNSAANTLNGGTGSDTMIGGAGNDTYIVDNTGDVVTENANEGTDLVQSSVTYTLSANVENLTLTGTAAINGTGNALDNVLIGNSAVNTLTGGAGNDTLDGGAGADKLIGGTGNDTYIVDNTGDVITENANEGTDLVKSSVTYTLATNVENLTLTGTAAINGTGNTLNNILTGNSAANTLNGGAGNDTLDGGAGNDSLIGGTGNDIYVMARGYGADTVSENDSTAGNTDVAQFGAGIATNQLWFRHVGNNLEVSIIGSTDKLAIQNWYSGSACHVEQFKTADGKLLLDTQVQNLVQAMAAFAPPAAGQTTLPPAYQTALAPVLAANWH
jgi:Ca2+-binding RTX toxin-like protein